MRSTEQNGATFKRGIGNRILDELPGCFNSRSDRVSTSASRLIIALVCLLNALPLLAQRPGDSAPVHRVDGAAVREWLVLGPFPSQGAEMDFLASVGGEANVRPKEGDTVSTSDGKQLTWTRLSSPYDVVNLERVFGIQQEATVYAYCELQSEQSGESHVHALANDMIWVRLNGELVGSIKNPVKLSAPLALQLKAGGNACLLKLNAGGYECSFLFQTLPPRAAVVDVQVSDSARRIVPGALVQFYSNSQEAARIETDDSGKAAVSLYPLRESYDLRVTSGHIGTWLFNLPLQPGVRRRFEVTLTNAVSIAGQVQAMDGSPQNAIVVQAIRIADSSDPRRADLPVRRDQNTATQSPDNGKTNTAVKLPGTELPRDSARLAERQLSPTNDGKARPLLPLPAFFETVLSDTNGIFRFVNLRPGQYHIRAHGPDGFVLLKAGAGTNAIASMMIEVKPGQTREAIQFRLAEIKKGVWRSYPIPLGLREANPTTIDRTPDGQLWIGTAESFLLRFDGLEFKTVASSPEIPANEINDLQHGPDGALWLGTRNGAVRHSEGRTETFSFTETLTRKNVRHIVADSDGTVWIASDSGLLQYKGGKWSAFSTRDGLPGNSIYSLARSRNGLLWMGTTQGLVRFDGQNFALVQPMRDVFPDEARRLYEARDGAIWFATLHGAYRYDGQTFARLGVEDGLPSHRIYDIAETSDGALWFATSKGLSKFNGTTIVNYTEADGLSNGWVRRVLVDADDVLWCANGWGISRFDPKGFNRFTNRDGLRNGGGQTANVLTLESAPDSGVWIGTEWGGVFQIEGQKLQSRSLNSEPSFVRRIHRAADGTLWLGSNNGLWKYEQGRFVHSLVRDWVAGLCDDREGNLWFGQGWAGGGLSRHNPKTGETAVFTMTNGLPNNGVWSVVQGSDGAIWVGTEGGLARIQQGKIEDFREKLGVPTGSVYHLRRDAEDTLWIGSRMGLHRWKDGKRVSLTSTNGLPDQHIWSTARTPDGIIWMGTDHNGLLGYDGKAVTAIDKREGLSANQIFSVMVEPDNSLLVGGSDGGLCRYRPAKNTPPSVRLVSVQLNDQVVTNFSSLQKILTGNRVTFQYREIDLKTHLEKRQFWYQVTAPSGGTLFSAVTKDRRFDWTPQEGGAYTFEVQAIDRDLNYSAPARLRLQVSVPWYANAWILTPGVGVFGGLLVWAFIVRALYVRKSREAALLGERVRIARDLHDHLGAGLTDLALAGDLVRQQIDQPSATQVLAARLSESARELTRTMGEAIWMIDPEKDTLWSFASFLCSYAERFFAGSALRLRFELPTEIPNMILPAEFRRSLLMVVKEALNNIAKHAHASEVHVKLELSNQELSLSIDDDGHGFAITQVAGERHGLANMQERLRELGGDLQIESTLGHGTRIQARVKLPKK